MFSCCLNYTNTWKLEYYIKINRTYLGIEEVRVTLEFIAKSLVWGVKELGLISDSLKESIINFILNIVVMESGFFLLILLE